MNISTTLGVAIAVAVMFVLIVRAIPWDAALIYRTHPRESMPGTRAAVADPLPPVRPATAALDRLETTHHEIVGLLDYIDAVYLDSHTRKWSRIPDSHVDLFDATYQDRPRPDVPTTD